MVPLREKTTMRRTCFELSLGTERWVWNTCPMFQWQWGRDSHNSRSKGRGLVCRSTSQRWRPAAAVSACRGNWVRSLRAGVKRRAGQRAKAVAVLLEVR